MQIILRAKSGDREAFAILFEQYKNLVYKTAYLMLGETTEAEDALQEVFVQVYRSLSGFDHQKAAFTTWLYRVTVNYCLNRRRKKHPLAQRRHEPARRPPATDLPCPNAGGATAVPAIGTEIWRKFFLKCADPITSRRGLSPPARPQCRKNRPRR